VHVRCSDLDYGFLITFFWFMTLFTTLVGDYSLVIEICCHYLTRIWEQCVLDSSSNHLTNYPEVEGNRFIQTLSNHLSLTMMKSEIECFPQAYFSLFAGISQRSIGWVKIGCVNFTVFRLSWIQVRILSFGVSTVYILLIVKTNCIARHWFL